MPECIRVPNGIITLCRNEFDCPKCGRHYGEDFYYKQMEKSKSSLIYKKCKSCGIKMGITYCMTGDIVVWDKATEQNY